MSGIWTDSLGGALNPNEPTEGNDIYQGDTAATGLVFVPNAGGGDDTLIGGGGYNIMGGGEGNDSLIAGPGGGEFYGNEGNDTLLGGDGADLLNGGAGDDVFAGGDGPDTMGLTGDPADYVWTTLPGGGWSVTDSVANRDGTDTVGADVERVYYAEPGIEQAPACFAEGTRIMTRGGEIAVERLRAGDLVLTIGPGNARFAPVRWIGHRLVDLARHPEPDLARPIRLRAGALGPGVPARDLLVSPDHALFLDGALVPAGLLVDGDAIAPAPTLRRVRYFHVELDAHAVLLAEGAPAESYLEDSNRMQFDNAGLIVALHADFRLAHYLGANAARGCAPRVAAGARLEAIRARLRGTAAKGGAIRWSRAG